MERKGFAKGKATWAFYLALAGMTLLKLWMLRGLPIYPLPSAICDDGLMAQWAWSMLSGDWLGPFSCFTFAKEPGFAAYLAGTYRLGLPYIYATSLLYAAGCLIVIRAAGHIVRSRVFLAACYAILLFCPVMTAAETGQRAYRNGLGAALSLWVVGGVLNLYFEIGEGSLPQNLAWSLITGMALGILWETKSDAVWLLPFAVTALALAAFLPERRTGRRAWKRLPLLFLPFCCLFLCVKAVDVMNARAYGASRIAGYEEAMSLLTGGIRFEDATGKVSLSRKDFGTLCEFSPTLASARKQVERQMDLYDPYDTRPGDGNVEDGWLGWALISGFRDAGYYKDCESASRFYTRVGEELSAAAARGSLTLAAGSPLLSLHLGTRGQVKEMLGTISRIWRYVSGHGEMESVAEEPAREDEPESWKFAKLTHGPVYYADEGKCFRLVGWALFPGHSLDGLDVYVEDEAGRPAARVRFRESRDVAAQYPDLEGDGAGKCRIDVKWGYDEPEDPAFFLAAYEGGTRVARAAITGLSPDGGGECVGAADFYLTRANIRKERGEAEAASARCNAAASLYRALGGPLCWAGLLSYAAFTVLSALQWKKRKLRVVESWLAVTGLGLSLLILFAGVASTHLENCPAINYMYLSAAYPIVELASLLSIALCADSCRSLARRNAGNGTSEVGER